MTDMPFYVDPVLKGLVHKQVSTWNELPNGFETNPMTKVTVKALHNLQMRASVEGHIFVSDEKHGGHDAGPAPIRYFLSGIAMCHMVWCVKSAALEGWSVEHLESEIASYALVADGVGRRIGKVVYAVSVTSREPAENVISMVESGARLCPIFMATANGIPIETTVDLNGERIFSVTYGDR